MSSDATPEMNLSDTSTWLPLSGLAPGFDAAKAPGSPALQGRTVAVRDGQGTIRYTFATGTVSVAGAAPQPCEVFEVADGLHVVLWHRADQPDQAVSLILDDTHGRALTVTSALGAPAPGRTAVTQTFVPGTIDGAPVSGGAPSPTAELIGRRVLWVYSAQHAYEHIYLSPQWYTWQCLAGPERGLADTDENSVWRIRPGIYVFAWREKVIPCGSVTVADHRDAKSLRSHGMLFGADDDGSGQLHFTFGAHGRLLSNTVHPSGYDPSRTGRD